MTKTIYLTKPSDLTAGLWWAREITGEQDLGRGPWAIVQVTGTLPFLGVRSVAYGDSGGVWREPYRDLAFVENPSTWEFGQRIDIPSDKDRVEWTPVAVGVAP